MKSVCKLMSLLRIYYIIFIFFIQLDFVTSGSQASGSGLTARMRGLWLDDPCLSQVRRRRLQRRQSVGGHRRQGGDPSAGAGHVLRDQLDLSAARPPSSLQQCSSEWKVVKKCPKMESWGQVLEVGLFGLALIWTWTEESWWVELLDRYNLRRSEDSYAHTTQDAIVFVKNGPELVAGEAATPVSPLRLWSNFTGQAGSKLQILKVKNMTYTATPGAGTVSLVAQRTVFIFTRKDGDTVPISSHFDMTLFDLSDIFWPIW